MRMIVIANDGNDDTAFLVEAYGGYGIADKLRDQIDENIMVNGVVPVADDLTEAWASLDEQSYIVIDFVEIPDSDQVKLELITLKEPDSD